MRSIRLTAIRLQPYSGGMISEFQELSDKVALLAEMTHALRRENAFLRQANAVLGAENAVYVQRMSEAQQRVEALLEKIPELVQAGLAEAAEEKDAR
ncbi:cell division protein ZapB [Oxalobacteraceae bacterium GrIS 1.11]